MNPVWCFRFRRIPRASLATQSHLAAEVLRTEVGVDGGMSAFATLK